MHLTIFVHALNEDGATKVVYSALRNTNIRNRYTSVTLVSSYDGPMNYKFNEIGVKVSVVDYKNLLAITKTNLYSKLKIFINICRLIKKADYLWINSVDQCYLLYKLISLFNKKSLLYSHESLYSDSLHFTHFSLSNRVNKLISNQIIKKNIILALPSETTKVNAANWFGINKTQVQYLPYGFEHLVDSINVDFNDDVYSFIVVGGIGYRKSQYQVVAAFKIVDEIIKKNPKKYRDWNLKVLGIRYRQPESQDFLHYVNQVFCSEKINYAPFLPIDMVKKELLNYHCLISASMNEALPLNVIEMMQLAGLVVGSNCEGQDELIIDNKTGYLFQKGQVSELAKTIIKVLDKNETSPKQLQTIGRLAKENIALNYSNHKFESNFNDIHNRFFKNSKKLIVFVSPWNYEVRENRSQPLARELARLGYKVLYVNFPVGQSLFSRKKERIKYGKYIKVETNLYHTIGGPLNYEYDWKDIRYVGDEYSKKQHAFAKYIKSIIKKSEFKHENNILLSNRAISGVFSKYIKFDLSIMDIEDPWPFLYDHWDISSQENLISSLKKFGESTDFAAANGPKIKQIAKNYFYNKDIIELPCGVDTNIFYNTPNEPPLDLPLGKKLIVFSGMVDERINFELVDYASKSLPECNFIFLGGVNPDVCEKCIQLSEKNKNVYFLGQKDVIHLKLYFIYADLFIIPYISEGGWNYTFPAKLFEYMIYGSPIVTSYQIDGVPDGYISCENNMEDFVTELKKKINGDSLRNERIEFAKNNSWDRLALKLSKEINKRIVN